MLHRPKVEYKKEKKKKQREKGGEKKKKVNPINRDGLISEVRRGTILSCMVSFYYCDIHLLATVT